MAFPARRIRTSRAVAAGFGLLLVATALALSPAGWPRSQSVAQRAAMKTTAPLLRGITSFHGFAASLWTPLAGSGKLREENKRLRETVAALMLEKAEAERQLRQAGGRLALTEMPQGLGLKCVAASVEAVGPAQSSRSVVIGRGSVDGIQPNMAVLSPPGVAGVVRQVVGHQALVQLVVDNRSEWGATVGDDSLPGIVQGTGSWDRLLFVFENPAGEPREGDTVYTSGVSGSLFPSGLPVGEVETVRFDKNGRRVADVRPLARLSAPDEVYVILASPPEIEPALRKRR